MRYLSRFVSNLISLTRYISVAETKRLDYRVKGALILSLILGGCTNPEERDLNWDRGFNSRYDLSDLYSGSKLPCHNLTLDDIISIALDRNLDLLVKEFEYQVQRETATSEKLKMMPSFFINEELSKRDKNTGSSSESLVPGVPPAPPSISSQRRKYTWQFVTTWNLLDFGISYFRSRQELNKSILRTMELERIQQKMILDIVTQYWAAMTAKYGIDQASSFVNKINYYRTTFRAESEERIISQRQYLTADDQLYETLITLQNYQHDYDLAKSELGRLMGLPPDIMFELAPTELFVVDVTLDELDNLDEAALMHRPELFYYDIEERIHADDVRIAILQMLPGVSLFHQFDYNRDRFLINHYWMTIGERAAWNLLAFPQHLVEKRTGQIAMGLSRANRLLLSMGALTQVHIAYLLYFDQLERYRLIKENFEIKRQIYEIAAAEQSVGKGSDLNVFNAEINVLNAELAAREAYGDLQVALEQLNNAMGLPMYYRNNRPLTECCEES